MNAGNTMENPISLDGRISDYLETLAEFGRLHDATVDDPGRKMDNITPIMADFVAHFVREGKARRVLELGASNGYSTIWLAQAVKENAGSVTAVESCPAKARMARENLSRAGLEYWVQLHQEDAQSFVARAPCEAYGLIFTDIEVDGLQDWVRTLDGMLRDDGFLIASGIPLDAGDQKVLFSNIESETGLSLYGVLSDGGRTLAAWGRKTCLETPAH